MKSLRRQPFDHSKEFTATKATKPGNLRRAMKADTKDDKKIAKKFGVKFNG
jgi:hypothetical protein